MSVEGEREIGPYWVRSRKPLAILLFLLPFVIFYELTLLFLPDGEGRFDIVAYQGLETLFERFGLAGAGMAIPGILLVVCLLAWHVMERNPWRIEAPTIPLMWIESMLVAVPVVVLGLLLPSAPGMLVVFQNAGDSGGIGSESSLMSLLSMAVGAGLYEELIFRWMLIALTHTLLADLFGLSNRIAMTVAVVLSSVLFMLAHFPNGSVAVVFYLLAGVWFSALYLIRGFGIAAGGHIAYDVAWVAWVAGGGFHVSG